MVKVISLSDEAYDKLKALKDEKSFSETVLELVEKNTEKKAKAILEFAGIWKDDSEADIIFAEILKRRHAYKRRVIKW